MLSLLLAPRLAPDLPEVPLFPLPCVELLIPLAPAMLPHRLPPCIWYWLPALLGSEVLPQMLP